MTRPPGIVTLPGMAPPATRTATFLFTDIEGSTRLWEEHRDAMGAALAAHDAILRSAIDEAGGTVVDWTGDGVVAMFEGAESAVSAALAAQRKLTAREWPETGPIRARMGIHSGTVEFRDGAPHGPALNRAARLMAIGHGGQILVSGATVRLVQDGLPPRSTLIDLGEQRLRDLDRPERVFQLAAEDLRRDFPSLRSLSPQRTNLPIQMTSFVGRERELADVVSRLRSQERLVTLVGVGGTGKTRLMLQAAAEAVERFPDGVWLVELAPITDPELIAQEIARSLGLQEEPGQSREGSLVDFLRSKRLLLLLDNCEHLIGPVATMVQRLLGDCPTLRVMATSREPLGVDGESIFPVPSLASTEAVRLFVERAVAMLSGFSLDPASTLTIEEICVRLDGIPLAIELAAARINALSVQEIADRLDDRFRLLTGGRRTAVPRQQTLQALIDWSWDLLEEGDRRLLRRLSVFAGGWTAEAAAAVAADPDSDTQLGTIDGLGRLADRSLIVVEHGDTTRYGMLETIRQYARDRLVASGEAEQLRVRHLGFFADVTAEAALYLRGPDVTRWLERLDPDIDNLRAALDWAFASDARAALEMWLSMTEYWAARVVGSESVDQLERVVESVRTLDESAPGMASTERSILTARILAAVAQASALFDLRPATLDWARESLVIARRTGDPSAIAHALSALTLASLFTGHADELEDPSDELIAIAKQVGEWAIVAYVLSGSAQASARFDPKRSAALMATASEAGRRSGSPRAIAFVALARANVAGFTGDVAGARAAFAEAEERYGEVADPRGQLMARSDLAHVLRRAGALAEAEELYRGTIPEWQYGGNRGAIANQLECFAYLALEHRQDGRAVRLLGAADNLREVAQSPVPVLDFEREEWDRAMALLHERVDAKSFDADWSAGRALTTDAAVTFALTSTH
ncbi:MAG: adenylate/guanylate cyclase domain-containing protein [Candidatus Limnocylindrales bacterium]